MLILLGGGATLAALTSPAVGLLCTVIREEDVERPLHNELAPALLDSDEREDGEW